MYFEDLKKDLMQEIKNNNSSIEYLEIFENKKEKIYEVVNKNFVYQYIFIPSYFKIWVIHGEKNEYLVLPNTFCSCQEFYFNVLLKKEVPCCYHILSQLISSKRKTFEVFWKKDDLLQYYLRDLLKFLS